MNSITNLSRITLLAISAFAALSSSAIALAGFAKPLVDDFGDTLNNSLGYPRQFMTDEVTGGNTTAEQNVADGVFSAKGDIVPPRGQPGWASSVLLLDPTGAAVDASSYQGLFLKIRILEGNVSVSANSTEIDNFDYHAAMITRRPGTEFQEIKIPFSSMKRAWSEQTPLNPATLNSISLVAFGMQKESFAFDIDEVSFY